MFGVPTWVLALLGSLALAAGAYFAGDSAGANRVIARDARAAAKLEAARVKMQAAFDVVQGRVAVRETVRVETMREVYRELPTITARPGYGSACIDDDGVRLLDRAAAAARAASGPEPAAPGPEDPRLPAHD